MCSSMNKLLFLAAVALLVLATCAEEAFLGPNRLVILFTGETVGEIEPCG